MTPLPQLRTVRPAAATPPPAAVPGRTVHPVLANPRTPAALRDLLQDVLDIQLVAAGVVGEFLAATGAQVSTLATRDRAGAALVRAGLLTSYQLTRIAGGTGYGLVLGPYRVLDRTGGGSVGTVFRAEHVTLGRRAAVKAVAAEPDMDPGLIDRFRTECRRIAAIDHPNVVAVLDAGEAPSPGPGKPALLYLAMEPVDGGDVEQAVYAGGPQPAARVCEWGRQAAAGLAAVHDAGLVHRDVKPPNLLLTPDGRVKLADFGLVRDYASTTTPRGSLVGSIEFLPPEQVADATAVGPPADVYGLGATLFWALTGELPVPAGRTVAETLKAIRTTEPRRLATLRPDAPPALDRLLARMLDRDPADRPTASALVREFAAVGGNTPEQLSDVVRQLERTARAREADARAAAAMVLDVLAGATATHDGGPAHGRRLRAYLRLLADRLRGHADWPCLSDSRFVGDLLACAPLHDLGMLGVSDVVLAKQGLLDGAERAAVEAHVTIGGAILAGLAKEHGARLPWLSTARVIVRSHHERWDGAGYPDALAAAAIPPAARLVAVADAYDSLRRPRPDRPAYSHDRAVAVMLADDGWFDPAVVAAFRACAVEFGHVHADSAAGGERPA